MDVVDPSTGERIESYADHTQSEVEEALDRANTAFEDWRLRPVREREELLAAAGEVLRENKRKYASSMPSFLSRYVVHTPHVSCVKRIIRS